MTFILAGSVNAFFAYMVWLVLQEEKGKKGGLGPHPPSKETDIFKSMRLILKSFAFWQTAGLAFFRSGTFAALQGLWLGPYLIDIEGYSPVQTGNVLIFLAIGSIVGGPVAGRLSDQVLRSRKGVALWGSALYTICLLPLAGILKPESAYIYVIIFFFIGFFNGSAVVIYVHAKELFPLSISGTIMTWTNFFTMSGAAVFMPLLGRVIESFPRTGHTYPAQAYHTAFLICFLCMAASVVFYAFCKEKKHSL
jgi:sugar phosphate permease